MLRVKHAILILSLLSLGPALSACADFDPDKLDIFGINEKKKLPGERRPVFPEGVPGVTQGVPRPNPSRKPRRWLQRSRSPGRVA